MAGSDVTLIEGVLNGTTNFILSRMEELGVSFEVALKEAQSLGIAEANPESDVGGWDTAAKLFILCKIVMGGSLTPDDISVTGIKDVTADEVSRAMNDGGRIRLIGKAFKKDGAVCASVSPQVVKGTHPFYFLSAQNKAVRYVSDTLGELMVSGGASGPLPAAALMDAAGPRGLFLFIALCALAVTLFALLRLGLAPPVPGERQRRYLILPRTTPLAGKLDPLSPET